MPRSFALWTPTPVRPGMVRVDVTSTESWSLTHTTPAFLRHIANALSIRGTPSLVSAVCGRARYYSSEPDRANHDDRWPVVWTLTLGGIEEGAVGNAPVGPIFLDEQPDEGPATTLPQIPGTLLLILDAENGTEAERWRAWLQAEVSQCGPVSEAALIPRGFQLRFELSIHRKQDADVLLNAARAEGAAIHWAQRLHWRAQVAAPPGFDAFLASIGRLPSGR